MDTNNAIIAFVVTPLMIMLLSSWWLQSKINKSNEKLIQAQQETIYRLINREPVTYAETNTEPTQPIQDSFSAWGNRMLTKEDMNQEP